MTDKKLTKGMTNYRTDFFTKKALEKVGPSSHCNINGYLVRMFGCARCLFIGTDICPHKIKHGGHHVNYICSFRTDYLKEQIETCGSATRIIQTEELFKLKIMSDHLVNDWAETGDIPEDYKHIAKLIVSLTDKMRRQDEGIKIQGEISHEVTSFKDIVEAQAEVVKDKDIIKEAEIIDSQPVEQS